MFQVIDFCIYLDILLILLRFFSRLSFIRAIKSLMNIVNIIVELT